MIGKLNHIAIAVPNIKETADQYRNIFGAKVSEEVEQPDHGVTTVFIDLGNTKIELLEALGEDSPIQKFIDKNPKGGMHHICLEVVNINDAIEKLNTHEVSITGTGKPKIGAHGKPVVFLHPKDCNGTLIELEEV
jgi:methylmalonyl-CoA/ethylmalonyl-CoA epimerase